MLGLRVLRHPARSESFSARTRRGGALQQSNVQDFAFVLSSGTWFTHEARDVFTSKADARSVFRQVTRSHPK